MRELKQTLTLATRDYVHEWQMSGCFVLALAAVLGPMLVLFGLKFGIVGNMVDELIEDPRNREIRPVGSGRYDQNWVSQMLQRKDVEFIVPRTRSIAASIQLKSENAASILSVEVIPSDRNDPLLGKSAPAPSGIRSVVLSATAAEKLDVTVGETLDGSLARRYGGEKQRVHLPLTVTGIAPVSAFSRDGLFGSILLVEALEDLRDGRAVPAMGWEGDVAVKQRTYPGFRLYAQSIYDVASLRDNFKRQGIEVQTRASDIELVQRMDRNLTTVFWAIAVIGLVGFSLSLGASLWANVDRKRKELSVLRLVGFKTHNIVWFPITQALYTAILGWALAVGLFYAAAWTINDMLAMQLSPGQQVCELLPIHLAISLGLTVGSAVLSAGLAGMRSARVEPSEGLREI
ncbi:MAG: ABC transporter permease [bacterium]